MKFSFLDYMKYNILDPEVQKTYYYVKKILDEQGFTQQLGVYLMIGQNNQPKHLSYLRLLWFMPILCFITGIVLMFKNIFLGIVIIIIGIVLQVVFVKKYYSPDSLFLIESSSQEIGSHKLMKIVADEMSKESSMEQIAEALKREIKSTINE